MSRLAGVGGGRGRSGDSSGGGLPLNQSRIKRACAERACGPREAEQANSGKYLALRLLLIECRKPK